MTATTITIPADNRAAMIDRVAEFLRGVLPGKAVSVSVGPVKRDRTSLQNRYLHGVAYRILSDATGYEMEDIAEYLCMQHFGTREKVLPGKRLVQVPLRTTTTDEDGKRSVLSTVEFAAYVEFIQRFAASKGLFIPDPEGS